MTVSSSGQVARRRRQPRRARNGSRRRGISVIVVLLLLSVTLTLSYAMMRSQGTSVAILGLCASSVVYAGTLTATSWGGSYSMSQRKAYYEPFMKETGHVVLEDEWDGNIATIRAQVDTGNYKTHVIDAVPETVIARVKQGQQVDVNFPSVSKQVYPAVISEVGTRAGDGNAFTVKADLTQRVETARPGMTAEVHFVHGKTKGVLNFDGYVIPMASIRQDMDGSMSVFVFDKQSSTLRQTTIVTGGVLDNEIAVMTGLQDDDIVATAGVSFLSDGQTVRLLE